MTRTAAIRHVDAFTRTPLEGNPAAVVNGERIDSETMQRIALNQHLSETVFLLPPADPKNHAHIRIFTPNAELPFAGHPTIAASHILISERRVTLAKGESLLLETGVGVIPVTVSGSDGRYTMIQAAPKFRAAPLPPDRIAACVGLEERSILRAEEVSTGIFWPVAQVESLDAMMRVRPDIVALMDLPHGLAIFCLGAQSRDAQVHVRVFAPALGVMEDPVTGSGNGCIAAFIAKHGLLPDVDGAISYVAEQGLEMGQPGRVYARVTGGPDAPIVHLGGHAVTVLRGELLLP